MNLMCKTINNHFGYRITNEVTGTRVTVGPFKNQEAAMKRMEQAVGIRKKLVATTEFHFTPSWNGWEEDEYSGEDITIKHQFPQL
jgi:hypothetical protein